MDIVKELQEAKQRRQQALAQINELKQQEQIILQEALRLDGEIRMLERLSRNGDKPNGQSRTD